MIYRQATPRLEGMVEYVQWGEDCAAQLLPDDS